METSLGLILLLRKSESLHYLDTIMTSINRFTLANKYTIVQYEAHQQLYY